MAVADFAGSEDFEMIDEQEATLPPKALAKIISWLQPTDYDAESSEFHRHLSSHTPDTGLWVCNTSQFEQWIRSDDTGCLWIKGAPGAGKSVVAASMVEHLRTVDNAPVLFFFFRYIVEANRTSRGLIQDWLTQLLPHSPRLQGLLEPLIDDDLDGVSNERLWQLFLSGVSSIKRLYCVADALDEVDLASDRFLARLNDLATYRPANVKILITSRPKQYLQSGLKDVSIVHINLELELVGKDIATYVAHNMEEVLPGNDSNTIRESLRSTICSRSQGLFLYARLILEQIRATSKITTPSEIEDLTRTIPVGLEAMYNSMLFNAATLLQVEQSIQVFLLECATHSSRPVRLNELAALLSSKFPIIKEFSHAKTLARSACAPLLEILEDETVQIIHHSFTEFLLDVNRISTTEDEVQQFPVLNARQAHKRITLASLAYLQSGPLSPNNNIDTERVQIHDEECDCGDWPCDCPFERVDNYDYQAARLQYPYLAYATKNWTWHASNYDVYDEEFLELVATFINPVNLGFQRWLVLEWNVAWHSVEQEIPSSLHIAAYSGLSRFAAKLINDGHDVESLDSTSRTPLHWASQRGHANVAFLLLQNGAQPNRDDRRGMTPLHEAAKRNHAEIVELLVKSGVDPLTPKTRENHAGRIRGGESLTRGETPLQYVCEQSHTESLLKMIPHLSAKGLEEALCECCRYGKFEAVNLLLHESSVSPNSQFSGATALYLATHSADFKCVEALLTRGADPNVTSRWHPKPKRRGMEGRANIESTPLDMVAILWSTKSSAVMRPILQLLLDHGAHLESRDGHGSTPFLNIRQERGITSTEAIRAFLLAGANPAASDNFGNTMLHCCVKTNRDFEIMKLLLDHGADINALGRGGFTPLHESFSMSDSNTNKPPAVKGIEVSRFLLEKGARSDIKNETGATALEYAASQEKCDLATFRLVLSRCSDVDALNQCLSNLGKSRPTEDKIVMIRSLISSGADLESKDKNGRTPLLRSVQNQSTFEALLHCGALLGAVDAKGRGVLHMAAHLVMVPRLRELVQLGLNPSSVDSNGSNLLHEIVGDRSLKEELVKVLLDWGISINSRNLSGQTCLHVYFEQFIQNNPEGDVSDLERILGILQQFGKVDIDAQDHEGLTILHLSALSSELDVLHLLNLGAHPSHVTVEKRTILHLACRSGMSGMVGFLLDKLGTADVNSRDSFGRTPLHDACTTGKLETVNYLIRVGANINIKDGTGRTPLHSCAEFSLEKGLNTLLRVKNEAAGQFKYDHYRPNTTHLYSCDSGMWYNSKYIDSPTFDEHHIAQIGSIITLLISSGADINAVDSHGMTPLDNAIKFNCTQMVAALHDINLRSGSIKQLQCANPKLAVEMALRRGSTILPHSVPDNAQEEILQFPSRYLHLLSVEDIKWLVNNGGNITGKAANSSTESFIHLIASQGLTDIMLLLKDHASTYDNPAFVRALVADYGAGDPIYRENLYPVLHKACRRKIPNILMLECLIEGCGVDINARALDHQSPYPSLADLVEGPTALHVLSEAKFWWQLDAIKYLVSKGADINMRDHRGQTPLHIATSQREAPPQLGFSKGGNKRMPWVTDCVKLLLELAADPNILDNDGHSCVSMSSSSPEHVKLLIENGADISNGTSAIILSAIRDQSVETLSLILDITKDPNIIDVNEDLLVDYTVTDQKRSALFCASFPGDINHKIEKSWGIIKLLIEHGADIYQPLNDRETLIHYTMENAEYPVMSAVLSCSRIIDFNAKDQQGRSVLLAACSWKSCLPGSQGNRLSPGMPGPVMQMLDLGVDVMATDNEGRTTLHTLLNNPNMEHETILQFLEREEVKPLLHKRDNKAYTALHYALRILRPEVCEKLISYGADLLSPDPAGSSALHHIASQYLQQKQIATRTWHTPSESYYADAARLWRQYLSLGGSLEVRDAAGNTPLLIYVSSTWRYGTESGCRHVQHYDELFTDADVHARDNDGETVLHVIARKEDAWNREGTLDRELFEFFVKRGLDPLMEDGRGRSALDVAAACEKKEILELFQYRA